MIFFYKELIEKGIGRYEIERKEIINNYRKIKDELNFIKLYKYSQYFNKSFILRTIELEVM